MIFNNIFLAIFFNVLLAGASWGSVPVNPDDTLKSKKNDSLRIQFNIESDFFLPNYLSLAKFVDTSLNSTQNSKLRFLNSNFNFGFSNSGLASRNLVFDFPSYIGFDDRIPYFSSCFLLPKDIKYYNVSNAYTDVYYSMGAKREQLFDLVHTQNFAKRLNFAANYRMVFSPGQYLRQKSDNAFLALSSNYYSKQKNYLVVANYFFNRVKVLENGGIANDSLFTYNFETNRKLVEINLQSAQNKVIESGFFVKQFFIPTLHPKEINSDSINKTPKVTGFGRFYHSLLFKNQSLVYSDDNPSSGFYPNVFLDTTLTLDSFHINKSENTVGWSNISLKSSANGPFVLFDVYGKYQTNSVFQQNTDTLLRSISGGLLINFKSVFGFKVKGMFSRIFNGYGENNQNLNLSISRYLSPDSLSNAFKSYFIFTTSQSRPNWFDMHNSGNHFKWDYDFIDIHTNSYEAGIKNSSLGLSVSYYDLLNFVYYDNFARPKQSDKHIEILQAELVANVKLGNWQLENTVYYQKSFGPDVIRLPEIASYHNYYFEHFAFKKALKFQIGTAITFLSGNYIMAYMPATRQFYLQNSIVAKPYPFIDLYLNAAIKRARIFIKIDHLNAGLMGRDYFITEHYPANDKLFRFGVSWRFFD